MQVHLHMVLQLQTRYPLLHITSWQTKYYKRQSLYMYEEFFSRCRKHCHKLILKIFKSYLEFIANAPWTGGVWWAFCAHLGLLLWLLISHYEWVLGFNCLAVILSDYIKPSSVFYIPPVSELSSTYCKSNPEHPLLEREKEESLKKRKSPHPTTVSSATGPCLTLVVAGRKLPLHIWSTPTPRINCYQ